MINMRHFILIRDQKNKPIHATPNGKKNIKENENPFNDLCVLKPRLMQQTYFVFSREDEGANVVISRSKVVGNT